MTARVDILHPDRPNRIVIVRRTQSEQSGWPIGLWWAELLINDRQRDSGAAAARPVIEALGT